MEKLKIIDQDNSIYGIYRNKIIVKLNVLSNSKGIQLCIVHEYILRRNIIPITFDNIVWSGKNYKRKIVFTNDKTLL